MADLTTEEIDALLDKASDLYDYFLTMPGDASDRRATLVNQMSVAIRQLLSERNQQNEKIAYLNGRIQVLSDIRKNLRKAVAKNRPIQLLSEREWRPIEKPSGDTDA